MATKKQPTKKAEEAHVTRISASEPSKKPLEKEVTKKTKSTPDTDTTGKNPFKKAAAYFGGAWYELRQVRWPNRRATWGMTLAVLGFTAAFVVIILLLDALFKYLFQLILG